MPVGDTDSVLLFKVTFTSGDGLTTTLIVLDWQVFENPDKKALLWNMEDNIQDIGFRVKALKAKGLKILENVYERLNVLDTVNTFPLEGLKREFQNYDLVIIDPLSHLIDGEENDSASVKPVMKYFQNICNDENKTIILVHHEAKGSDGKGSGQARGSSSFFDNVRLSYSLRCEDDIYNVTTSKNNYGENRPVLIIDPWLSQNNRDKEKMMGKEINDLLNDMWVLWYGL